MASVEATHFELGRAAPKFANHKHISTTAMQCLNTGVVLQKDRRGRGQSRANKWTHAWPRLRHGLDPSQIANNNLEWQEEWHKLE